MDKAIRTVPGIGEVGIDTAASAGNGAYYVKHYESGYDACGFDSVDEAWAELKYIMNDPAHTI